MNLIADLLMVWKNYFKIQKIMQRSERRNAKVTSLKAIVNMVIDVTLNIKVDQPNKQFYPELLLVIPCAKLSHLHQTQ
jgi:hypothetical protein